MLELPETLSLSEKMKAFMPGKIIKKVLPPTNLHKFTWFNGNPEDYDSILRDEVIKDVKGFGSYLEIEMKNSKLCISDGVNIRYLLLDDETPDKYQLMIIFSDDTKLAFTVAMYGGIIVHSEKYDNEYYQKSLNAVSLIGEAFTYEFFKRIFDESKKGLSVKAFLATEQRFPGLGNGVLQDILFEAGFNPRRKIETFSDNDLMNLHRSIKEVLLEMKNSGGRDTEKDIFGNYGNYKTKMGKNTIASGCPKCHEKITKEAYLGGSVYYCPHCQK